MSSDTPSDHRGQPAAQVLDLTGGGTLIATVKDADGNVTGLWQAPPSG
jgi:hypothetical protein